MPDVFATLHAAQVGQTLDVTLQRLCEPDGQRRHDGEFFGSHHVSALKRKTTSRASRQTAARLEQLRIDIDYLEGDKRETGQAGMATGGKGGAAHAAAFSGRRLEPYRSSRSIAHGFGMPRSRQLLTAFCTIPSFRASALTLPSAFMALSRMFIR